MAERRHPTPDLWKVWEKAARQRLQKAIDAASGCVPVGLDLQSLVRRGEPGPTLVGVAHAGQDVLVVGAGRHSRPARAWHGRVSRYCVAHARCPVLAVPPPAMAQTAGHGLRAWSFRHRELTVARALPPGPDSEKLRRDGRGG
jgi:nucleotide-binding universal stress UspA family protein